MPYSAAQLRNIHTFNDLLRYLEEKLDWPLKEYQFDEITFEYQPEELGLKDEEAAKVKNIHQLRPLQSGQPWGIFFVEFENKKLPVVVLRRILSHLVIKKRASANKAREAAWHAEDLMFITTFGEDDSVQREIAFAHFHQSPGDLPTLRVLGWDGGDTPLKLAHVDHQLRQYLSWPDDPADLNLWRDQWRKPFRHRIGHIIRTADALADVLAALARGIRDKAMKMISVELPDGPLRLLHKAFRTSLIHDLTEESFADTYAQTITYGLLTAAISRTDWCEGRQGTFIIAENVTDMVPITNPFLREMLQTFLKVGGRKGGIDFDELGIQDVVELLRGEETDLPAILRDFGNKTQGEDPVIHFYEHFLSAYNKKLKIQRGVFYTPQPVVSYIIRSVHELLLTEFGLEDGLASYVTWGEMIERNPEMKLPVLSLRNSAKLDSKDILISPDTPFVMILDIATGTGTFLVEIIDVISKTMKAKWQKQGKSDPEIGKLWNEYVPKHLLPRLYGYELMMAPYAIAHMKIGLKLFETGYQFKSNERVRVYLTNTLEPPSDAQQQLTGILPALAHEAEAVNDVKRNVRFTVLVGNPPYSNFGMLNKIPWILKLLDEYKQGLNEIKINLDDDFIKFIRLSHYMIDSTGYGILGFITNNTFFDGITHRQMRKALKLSFPLIAVCDLHGSVKKHEVSPDGSKDDNVFDIQQGVGITFLAKLPTCGDSSIFFSEMWGNRRVKYDSLSSLSLDKSTLTELNCGAPNYFFTPKVFTEEASWKQWISIIDAMPLYATGVKTHLDDVFVGFSEQEIHNAVNDFVKQNWCDVPISSAKRASPLKKAILLNNVLRNSDIFPIMQYAYRAFDTRKVAYSPSAIEAGDHRYPVMQHLFPHNIALVTTRQLSQGYFSHALVTRSISDMCLLSTATKECAYVFPLMLYPNDALHNISKDELNIAKSVKHFLENYDAQPNDFLQYTYAILYSYEYRTRYVEFLKIDFPRIPRTSSAELFRALAELGGELVALHLLESPKVNNFITAYTDKGDNAIPKKPTWKDNAVWINPTQCFEGVPENVWNFHIGGYQVCEKWLKDRKGRTLSPDDITHYQRIVVALNETIRIMAEIDQVIDEHGGWPIK